MAWLDPLKTNWFDLLQTLGIVGGLFLTTWTIHLNTKVQRATNLLQLTQQHRELWMTLFTNPELSRVLRDDLDLNRQPPTDDETRFVTMLILHLNGAYQTIKADVLKKPEGLTADIRGFFALPIPRAVWERAKHFYDSDFVAFVEAQRRA
jgi:hypothetical protein